MEKDQTNQSPSNLSQSRRSLNIVSGRHNKPRAERYDVCEAYQKSVEIIIHIGLNQEVPENKVWKDSSFCVESMGARGS
jgi:hypothetical protein